jgi:hypothetical protein
LVETGFFVRAAIVAAIVGKLGRCPSSGPRCSDSPTLGNPVRQARAALGRAASARSAIAASIGGVWTSGHLEKIVI